MPNYIRVPLALDILLIVIEQLVPASRQFLPLGGGECVQLGILLCLGIVAYELGAKWPWNK
ncbi:MAG: hypothetical protein WAW96_15750 [Alphaproteobacteria bacterium]